MGNFKKLDASSGGQIRSIENIQLIQRLCLSMRCQPDTGAGGEDKRRATPNGTSVHAGQAMGIVSPAVVHRFFLAASDGGGGSAFLPYSRCSSGGGGRLMSTGA